MREVAIGMAAPDGVALTVLADLKNGNIDDAIDSFVEKLTFKDHGLGLEFKDKEHLSEFFRKARELYPDSLWEMDTMVVSVNRVMMEWTLQTMVTEPFYNGLCREVPVTLHGVSVVETENGKITDWADYYDGLTSRRTALAAHFGEWVES